jgi:hypothetical protein
MQRDKRCILSRCDYILGTKRRLFKKVCLKDTKHYFSDHIVVVGILIYCTMRENRRYLIGRKKFRLEMGKGVPKTKADAIFQELKEHDGAPSPRMEDLDL